MLPGLGHSLTEERKLHLMHIECVHMRGPTHSVLSVASRIEFNTPVSYNEFRFKSTFFLSNITRIMKGHCVFWHQRTGHFEKIFASISFGPLHLGSQSLLQGPH